MTLLQDFIQEHQALQERAIRLGGLLELKAAELAEIHEQREELMENLDEAHAESDRLQVGRDGDARLNWVLLTSVLTHAGAGSPECKECGGEKGAVCPQSQEQGAEGRCH